jgi:hypothetical protein
MDGIEIIDGRELAAISERLLNILKGNEIKTLSDLRRFVGSGWGFPPNLPRDLIGILERPSNQDTNALVITYERSGVGLIINTVSNLALGYTQVMYKADVVFPGYRPFARDDFGRASYARVFPSSEFSTTLGELEKFKEF